MRSRESSQHVSKHYAPCVQYPHRRCEALPRVAVPLRSVLAGLTQTERWRGVCFSSALEILNELPVLVCSPQFSNSFIHAVGQGCTQTVSTDHRSRPDRQTNRTLESTHTCCKHHLGGVQANYGSGACTVQAPAAECVAHMRRRPTTPRGGMHQGPSAAGRCHPCSRTLLHTTP